MCTTQLPVRTSTTRQCCLLSCADGIKYSSAQIVLSYPDLSQRIFRDNSASSLGDTLHFSPKASMKCPPFNRAFFSEKNRLANSAVSTRHLTTPSPDILGATRWPQGWFGKRRFGGLYNWLGGRCWIKRSPAKPATCRGQCAARRCRFRHGVRHIGNSNATFFR